MDNRVFCLTPEFSLPESICHAWNFIFDRFFCAKTHLLYDALKDDTSKAYDFLPTPEQIQADYPNACGWGTGMEDSLLSGGSAADALLALYRATGNKAIKPMLDELFCGLFACAEADGNSGFAARSLSPDDGKSYYSNSSRDQYTHYVYACVRFYDSGLADETQKETIRRTLRNIAEKCLRDITPENGNMLLRADGEESLVSTLWGALGPHEYLRLPMFYIAAFHVTGDSKWQTEYLKYRDEAVRKSHGFDYAASRCYCALQMAYSLRLVYDLDPDQAVRTELLSLLKETAAYGHTYALENGRPLCEAAARASFNFTYKKWYEVEPMKDLGIIGGKRYLNPGQNENTKVNGALYPIRGVGEAASLVALCPNYPVSDELCETLAALAENIDYAKHHTYAPLLVACGYLLCAEKRTAHLPKA